MLLFWLACTWLACASNPPSSNEIRLAIHTASTSTLLQEEVVLSRYGFGPELALVKLYIWGDIDPDSKRLEEVGRWLKDFPEEELRPLRAELALRMGNPGEARRLLGDSPPETPEARLFYARLALATGEPVAGLAWIQDQLDPLSRLTRSRLLAFKGDTQAAQAEVHALLLKEPDLLEAQVLRMELSELKVRSQLADLVRVRYRLPPRLEARALGAQARTLRLQEKIGADPLASMALKLDATEPCALLVVADSLARAGKLQAALEALEPGSWTDPDIQIARILLLLELDRLEAADALLAELNRRQALVGLATGLRYVVQVVGRGERPDIPAPPPDRPILSWARGIALAQGLDLEAPSQLSEALSLALRSEHPFEKRLAGRIQLARARTLPEAEGLLDARAALRLWPDDSGMHLQLGLFYEAQGRVTGRATAAAHFNRATALCGECALALYEQGRFYQDSPDSRTQDAWTRYLALKPSGPRAERIADFLAEKSNPDLP